MDFKDLMLAYVTDLRLTDKKDAYNFALKLIPNDVNFLEKIFGNKHLMHPVWEVVKYWIKYYSHPYPLARINEVLIECGFIKCTIPTTDLDVVTAKPGFRYNEHGVQITPAKIAYSKLAIAKVAAKNLLLEVYDVDEDEFDMVINKLKPELKKQKRKGRIDGFQWKRLFPRNKTKTNINTYDIRLMQLLIQLSPKQQYMFWLDQAVVFERNLSHITLYDSSFISCYVDHDPFNENLLNYLSENDENHLSLLERKFFEISVDPDYRLDKDFDIMQNLHADDVETLEEVAYQDSLYNGVKCNLAKPLESHIGRDLDLHGKLMERKRLVMFGLGGIGKSESLRHYCDNYSLHFDNNILWIDASSNESIRTSFKRHREYIKKLNTEENELPHDVYRFFIDSNKKFLVAFDNAKSYKELKDFFPPNYQHAYVIISSQSEQWGERFTKIRLKSFNDEEAFQLVKKSFRNDQGTETEYRELCKTLGNFPLALQQAIAFIKRGCSIRYYIDVFHCSMELLDQPCSDDDYPHTICTTWKMTFEELSKSKNSHAVDLLNIMAYMNGSCIDCSLFGEIEGIRNIDILIAINVLQSFSLVTPIHQNGSCSLVMVHDLVQLVVRKKTYGTSSAADQNYALTLFKILFKTTLKNQFSVDDNSFGHPWLMHLTSLCGFIKDLDVSQKLACKREVILFMTNLEKGRYGNDHDHRNIINVIEKVCEDLLNWEEPTEEFSCVNSNSTSDYYPMQNSPHGLCVIINNSFKETTKERNGTMKDEERLKETFHSLDFTVEIHPDKTADEMKELFEFYAGYNHDKYDCFVCFILSHGCEGHVLANDSKKIRITEIRNMFSDNMCKSLSRKPKLFFIQACQDQTHNMKVSDGQHETHVKNHQKALVLSDFFIYVSSISGTQSWRRSAKGSYFIQTICDFLNNDKIHLKDLVRKVNSAVSNKAKQMPEAFDSLRKNVLFSKDEQ